MAAYLASRTIFWSIVAVLLPFTGLGSLALQLAAQERPEPKRVALLVGVNKYQKPGLENLRFAERDVEQMAIELRKQGFIVKVLLGSAAGAEQATRENILRFARNMARNLGKEDLALVMLAGHGQQLLVSRPDGTKKEDAFYVPVEGVASQGATLISLSELIDDILAPNVGRKLLLVDACRDVPSDPSRGARGIQGKVISLPEDTAVFFSCRAGQRSFEKEELQHGLFTYYLLEGMRGSAARDNEVSWGDLVTHVQRQMDSADARKLLPADDLQRPIAAGGVEHTILAKFDVRPTPRMLPQPQPPPPGSPSGSGELAGDKVMDAISAMFGKLEVLRKEIEFGLRHANDDLRRVVNARVRAQVELEKIDTRLKPLQTQKERLQGALVMVQARLNDQAAVSAGDGGSPANNELKKLAQDALKEYKALEGRIAATEAARPQLQEIEQSLRQQEQLMKDKIDELKVSLQKVDAQIVSVKAMQSASLITALNPDRLKEMSDKVDDLDAEVVTALRRGNEKLTPMHDTLGEVERLQKLIDLTTDADDVMAEIEARLKE